ncbi:cobalt-precorrin-6A reductase [Leptolyngbya sp. BC1307]|uniref:cobalt-precorrin-6A reductase n=1 Tax=Leptolyngbya sp. BC1307 TaxID=2029589 RepID=UPI000EFD9646|nr:cobalt-precorrin-6A reductase [Leptolyngbya sp. BC1307]
MTAITPQVWLIGGTRESADLARRLSAQGVPYLVTVTTPSAADLYPDAAQIRVGKLTAEAIQAFVMQQRVQCILDASHPFACEISQQAIALSQKQAIAYIRYERPAQTDSALQQDGLLTVVESLESLIASDLLHDQRVLLTIGYRHLARFTALRQTSKLFARVLPSVEAVAGAIAAGFASSEIIALRPPVSLALEKALWQQWQITQVVAKASGQPGGETIKQQVAQQLGVGLILIQRPAITYPKQTSTLSIAVKFCSEALSLY